MGDCGGERVAQEVNHSNKSIETSKQGCMQTWLPGEPHLWS